MEFPGIDNLLTAYYLIVLLSSHYHLVDRGPGKWDRGGVFQGELERGVLRQGSDMEGPSGEGPQRRGSALSPKEGRRTLCRV